MRIGILCHSYLPHRGGVEVVVNNLGRRLAREHRVTLVTTAFGGRSGVAEEDGMEVHRLPALHFTERRIVPYPIPFGPGLFRALRALSSADVLHAHGSLYPTSLLAAALRSLKRIPLVLTEHVGFVTYPSAAVNAVERAAWSLIGARVVRAACAVAVFNERVASWLRGRCPGLSPRSIPNGVDSARFCPLSATERRSRRAALGLPQDVPLALFAGRESAKKNLDAVLRIPRDTFHLVVCGDRRGLRGERLTDLGLVDHDAMPGLYGCADLLVHAATGEGFPLAVQEALACGLPVALLWDDGYAASMDRGAVLACASLDELSSEVRRLANDPERRAALSARGRALAEQRWSWDASAATYLALYRESIGIAGARLAKVAS